MSSENLQLRFDGPSLREHAMDVTLIGPALFAFGEMCQEANRVLNGNATKVKVLLKADVKANCVTVDLHVVQTLWQHLHTLMANQDIADAKQIMEWLGLFGIPGGVWGLIKFLAWKKDKKETSTEIRQSNGGNQVIIKIEGDNNSVTIPEQVYRLSKNIKVVEAIKVVAAQVSESNGIDDAVVIYDKKETLKIDQALARDLQKAHADAEENEPQVFTAYIRIYSPVMDIHGKKWKFRFNGKVETIDISGTTIATKAIEEAGSVGVGDTYQVKLQMIQRQTKSGEYKAEYKVLEVLKFIPGSRMEQSDMSLPDVPPSAP